MLLITIVACLALFPLTALILNSITLYNSLVRVRFNVDTAWSNIDVLLKRRHDELGKLLDAVKAYMGYEQSLLTQITQLRAQANDAGDNAARIHAEGAITPLVGRLLAVAENYPQLHASENFRQLQSTIGELETQIAHRRELYNDAVNINNARTAQFPDLLFAGVAGLHRRDLFVASDDDKKDVNVAAALA